MTRIFEALRKGQVRPAPGVQVPAAPLPARPAAIPHAARRSSAVPAVPEAPRASVTPIPFAGAVERAPDVVREMTALRMTLEGGSAEPPRVVAFFSAQGGEGTSTVVLQFASVLAGEGRARVVVVDLHARRPSPAIDASARAAAVPTGDAAPDGGTFDVLPLPEAQRGGSGLPPSLVKRWVDALSVSYDWVILDGPPVVESPDAAPLAAIADQTALVIQAGRAKRPVLHKAVDLLRKAGANVVGTILNRRRLEIPGVIYRRI